MRLCLTGLGGDEEERYADRQPFGGPVLDAALGAAAGVRLERTAELRLLALASGRRAGEPLSWRLGAL